MNDIDRTRVTDVEALRYNNVAGGGGFTGAVSTVMNSTQLWTMAVESDGRLHEIIQTPDTVTDGVVGTATYRQS